MKCTKSFLKPKQPRQGALLLVVLSILVLFALVGLTFVVGAAAFNTGSQANLRRDVNRNTPPEELDAVLIDLLRGPRARSTSRIMMHDLLRDMWGNQSVIVTGNTTIARPQTQGGTNIEQLWEIKVAGTSVPSDLFRIEDYYTGSVLTFMSGDARGQSHRILKYRPEWNTSSGNLQQVVFVIDQDPVTVRKKYVNTNTTPNIEPANGDSFVVNDPPFNGTGQGFDPTQTAAGSKRTLSLRDGNGSGAQVALIPNIVQAYPKGIVFSSGLPISVEAGGLDEPYDAPDYQNMFLSYVPISTSGMPSTNDILPSFHRQDLLRYWRQQIAANDGTGVFSTLTPQQQYQAFLTPYGWDDTVDNQDTNSTSGQQATWDIDPLNDQLAKITRSVLLRPNQLDHPNFDGSNPNFNMFGENFGTASGTAVWDIDNDLDGVADSIWIDVGLPLKTDPQGRQYKPLAAILVKDLDGLVNVNTDGTYSHFAQFESGTLPVTNSPSNNQATTLLGVAHQSYSPSWTSVPMANPAPTPQRMQLPLGSGYGPADVSLFTIFQTADAYKLVSNRYGQVAGINPGVPGGQGDDPRSRMDNIGLSNIFNTRINNRFGTPPDRLGVGRMYMDYTGRPRFQPQIDGLALNSQNPPTGPTAFGQSVDDPYEFDPLHFYQFNKPFTYQELEHVLRFEEYDSSTLTNNEDRLLDLAKLSLRENTSVPTTAQQALARRRLITTASFQVPTANRVDIPFKHRGEDPNSSTGAPQNLMFDGRSAAARRPAPTLVSLLQERLRVANPTWNRTMLSEKSHQLLPPEIFRGEPLDLNRLIEAPAVNVGDNIFDLQNRAIQAFQTGYSTTENSTSNLRFVNWYYNNHNNSTAFIPEPPGWNAPTPASPTSYSMTRQLMARHLYVMMLLMVDEDYVFPLYNNSSYTADQKKELTRRRIAQWSINVVDFRDRDGVMTPFEYDFEPFTDNNGDGNPWDVDGVLDTTTDNSGFNEQNRRVVWGAEAPDLLMTESLAFHDKRVKDTVWEQMANGKKTSDPTTPDPHLDQYRIPQGSLFLEFYNPRNLLSNSPASSLPLELYTNGALEVTKKTPNGHPVWRVVITTDDSASPSANPLEDARNRTDTINFQPNNVTSGALTNAVEDNLAGFDMLNSGSSQESYEIDRLIYFTNIDPNVAPYNAPPYDAYLDRTFFYRDTAPVGVEPNQYLVVGPRQSTYISARPNSTGMTPDPSTNIDGRQVMKFANVNGGQFIHYKELSGNSAYNTGTADVLVTAPAASIQPMVGMTVTMEYPAGETVSQANNGAEDTDGAPYGIGLNVSEPLRNSYYSPLPTLQSPPTATGTPTDLYTDGSASMTTPTVLAIDEPFDRQSGMPLADANLIKSGSYPTKPAAPASGAAPLDAATIKGFRVALLQRVANPLANYDPIYNPYITVDSLSIDLTVYNGEDSTYSGETTAPNDWNSWDEDEDPTGLDYYFGSRERGRRQTNLESGESKGNLAGIMGRLDDLATGSTFANSVSNTPMVYAVPEDTNLTTVGTSDQEHFPRVPRHTLGYVNRSFGKPLYPGDPNNPSRNFVNNAYRGSPDPVETRDDNPYNPTTTLTLENNPFAWLNWTNAPYVSEYDLLQVPSSSPQRLVFEYSTSITPASNDPYNFQPLGSANGGQAVDGEDITMFQAPFRYLFNFFHSSTTNNISGATAAPNQLSGQFARLFDFVHVPSRFSGTNKWFNENQFNPSHTELHMSGGKFDDARLGYTFPFNRRSEFREPGKINLNTIPSEEVYNAIFDPNFWNDSTRMMFDFPNFAEFSVNRRGYSSNPDQYPSRFSHPFRPAAAAEMMPELGPATGSPDKRLLVPPVEATILRSTDPTASSKRPLFDLRLTNPSLDNREMRHYRTDDNPMLRYQAYQRLGNIAGTQSNVFAVWITIGYFEVEPTTVDAEHPDGWRLGQELGIDTGEIERHRAFYIIDRSIPVGYLPGEDLNVEDTIMLRRFIE